MTNVAKTNNKKKFIFLWDVKNRKHKYVACGGF